MEYNEDDEIRQLYDEFCDAVRKRISMDLDADDLIAVYDFASDNDDYFIMNEVLTQASRSYPGNLEFKRRRAWMYIDSGHAEAAMSVIADIRTNTFIDELLRLHARGLAVSAGVTADDLDRLLAGQRKSRRKLDDEDVIRLVATAVEFGLTTWVEQHYEDLKTVSEYPDTLANEMLSVNEIDPEVRRRIYEDLTMMQPFNLSLWEELAELCLVSLEDNAGASNALTYSLSIDPASRKSRLMKATLMLEENNNDPQAIKIVRDLIAEDPADPKPVGFLSMHYFNAGKFDEAYAIVSEYNNANKPSRATLEMQLRINPRAVTDDVISRFIGDTSSSVADKHYASMDVIRWCRGLYDNGCTLGVGRFLSIYVGVNSMVVALPMDFEFCVEALYRGGYYAQVAALEYDSEMASVLSVRTLLLLLLAYVRVGKYNAESMLELVAAISNQNHLNGSLRSCIDFSVLGPYINNLSRYLNGDKDVTLDDCDPFKNPEWFKQ